MRLDAPSETMRHAHAALSDALEDLKRQIAEYPRPVAGCDAQFNHLLAERRRASRALAALDESIHIPTPRAP